jgi:hypothetical protein
LVSSDPFSFWSAAFFFIPGKKANCLGSYMFVIMIFYLTKSCENPHFSWTSIISFFPIGIFLN